MFGSQSEEDDIDSRNGDTRSSADGLADEHGSQAVFASKDRHSRLRGLENAQASGAKSTRQDHLNKGYRELFNSTIQEIATSRATGQTFAASFVGHTLWSSREKDVFFRQLGLSGVGDLRTLSKAIGSKNELQIRAYLLLLQESAEPRNSINTRRDNTREATQPSAVEISADVESTLNLAARTLAARVDRLDGEQEQQRHGREWLIDEDLAHDWDLRYQERLESTIDNAIQIEQEDRGEDDHDHSNASNNASNSFLLRPTSFLQLSRSLFMNNNQDDELNWHHLDAVSSDSSSPSIYRSAFQDLHNIAINITRRLVQATLFQAMSRLRAEDSSRTDWTPSAVVRQIDARAAMDFLNMPSHRAYWETVVRRCKVAVYSESKKYKDGRPSTKNGCLLSYDEVEQEMGRASRVPARPRSSNEADMELDSEQSVFDDDDDDDMYTTDESTGETVMSDPDQNPTQTHLDLPSKKRKRASSPRSAARAEEARLELLDQQASFAEEQRIRKQLGLYPLPDAPLPPPASSTLPLSENSAAPPSWRETLQYESEWERPQKIMVKDAEFEDMDARGKRRRGMRRMRRQNMVLLDPRGEEQTALTPRPGPVLRRTRSGLSTTRRTVDDVAEEVVEISSGQASSSDDDDEEL